MNQTDVDKLRAAVEGVAIALIPHWQKLGESFKKVREDLAMNQSSVIEKQIVAALQRQGADSGTANVAARHAMSIYGMQSRMGTASMQQILKTAGEYAERTQKGFKYKARSK